VLHLSTNAQASSRPLEFGFGVAWRQGFRVFIDLNRVPFLILRILHDLPQFRECG
jgi:hypothetical protein